MRRLRDEDLSPYEPILPRSIDWIETLIRAIYGAVIGLGFALFIYSKEVLINQGTLFSQIKTLLDNGGPIILVFIVLSIFFHKNLLQLLILLGRFINYCMTRW